MRLQHELLHLEAALPLLCFWLVCVYSILQQTFIILIISKHKSITWACFAHSNHLVSKPFQVLAWSHILFTRMYIKYIETN